MPKVITSTELQKQTREAIDYARVERDAVIVETHGRPMAVLLGYEEYQGYLMYKNALQSREKRSAVLREPAAENVAYDQLPADELLGEATGEGSIQRSEAGNRYPLRGTPYTFTDPFGSVAEDDWTAMR